MRPRISDERRRRRVDYQHLTSGQSSNASNSDAIPQASASGSVETCSLEDFVLHVGLNHREGTMRAQTNQATDRRGEGRRSVDLLINRFLNGYPYLCRATDISRTG